MFANRERATSGMVFHGGRRWAALSVLLCGTLVFGCDANPPRTVDSAPRPAGTRQRSVLRIAAASDLHSILPVFIERLEQSRPGIAVEAIYGASGTLQAQIREGAPFDLFLSADAEYVDGLVRDGLADASRRFDYARGHLCLWAARDAHLDVARRGIQTLEDAAVRRVALANPRMAPYGRAAESTLRHFELLDRLQPKLVLAENVAQAAQFIESGAAEIGFISVSLALSPPLKERGEYWIVPDDAYPPLIQSGVILRTAGDMESAEAVRDVLISPENHSLWQQAGFTIVER